MVEKHFSAQESVMMFLKLIVLVIIATTFLNVEGIAIKKLNEVDTEEASLLSARFLYNTNCLMKTGFMEGNYYSENIIDLDKFNEEHLHKCNQRPGFSAKLDLDYNGKLNEAIMNKDYIVDSRACFDSKRFSCVFNRYYVLVDDNGKTVPGYLSINAIVRKNV